MDHHFQALKRAMNLLGWHLVLPAARGNWEDNRCKQHKLNSGQVANFQATTNSGLTHGGFGFSLPWYRSILDVNIDAFEEKRWRYPGVDFSDFFNFGFNEDSWKQYCTSLEQSLEQSYIHNMMPIHHSSKLTQAYEFRHEQNSVAIADTITQVESSSEYADQGKKQMGLPKGKAIQVETSTGERQPTMDLKRPHVWEFWCYDTDQCAGFQREFFSLWRGAIKPYR